VEALLAHGAQVTVLTRSLSLTTLPPCTRTASWEDLPRALVGAEIIINLAGEGIAGRRWTPARKKVILDSLVATTRALCDTMATLAVRLLVGEMAEEMLLSGSFVQPQRAWELGFRFRFERLELALADLL